MRYTYPQSQDHERATSESNANTHHTRVESVHDISKIRRKGMDLSIVMGFPRAGATKVAVVISELARNILIYATWGTITLIVQPDLGTTKYIKIIDNDNGPGIPNLDRTIADIKRARLRVFWIKTPSR